jgi:adenine-specific DNA-methyltransferase
MTTDTKMNEKKQRLLNLLREMFQLNQPDLEFGLYRIMHAKRAQVESFLEIEFDQLIDKVFASRGARHEEEAKKEYEAARQKAIEFGAPDPEAAPKVQQARARYDAVRLTGGEDAEIYDHLHRFFSRYYDEGDFMSLRRYGKGAAGGAETYAVPYDGSEVLLHWANKDQYYIKTTENFAEFSFDPRKAQQMDEKGISSNLFEDDAAGGAALKVHFRIVDAAEGAHNNTKASDKDERYFILDDESPIAWEGTDLVVRINYRPDSEKTGQKAKWQEKRNDQLVQKVLDALAGVTGDGKTLAEEYRAVLSRDVPKGKDKKQPLLARYVGQYTASNTMDYFIHKDLGGFLRRELDFYLKNEVLKLDDFVGSEDADVQAGLTEARMKAMQNALEKAQAIRLLSQRLIDFLAHLEDFQKKLWLKKKFVVETHYCITLDRIPEKFYPEIASNDRQREEWVELYAIDEIKAGNAAHKYSVPLTENFLKENSNLVVDTAFFSASFTNRLLESIDGLSESLDGVLIHSDNFQAINSYAQTLDGSVGCVYIDPPYNSKTSEILYKNTYKHSSWASLIRDRVKASKRLLSPVSSLVVAIDENEQEQLGFILADAFPDYKRHCVAVIHNKKGIQGDHFSYCHEYAYFCIPPGRKKTNEKEIPEENWDWANLRKWGSESTRDTAANCFYPILVRDGKIVGFGDVSPDDFHPGKANLAQGDGVVAVYPVDSSGVERKWRYARDSVERILHILRVQQTKDGEIQIHKAKNSQQYKTVWDDPLYIAGDHGTKILTDMGIDTGENLFPKSIHTVLDSIHAVSEPGDLVLDFFGGSGTTAHAVIEANRRSADLQRRSYVLVEQGDYFDFVLLKRVKKAIYSPTWNTGKPMGRSDGKHTFKYIRLESYEDCLNNLALNANGEAAPKTGEFAMQRDYLLHYMLDVETQGSQSLLNVEQFRDPTAYQLEIKKPGSDERVKRNVDLVETFNWLIGLHVDRLHARRRFAATFVRKPDPLLPEDANTRLQVETLTEAEDGAWWFRPVEGYVRTKPGDDRHRQSVLVLWRTLTNDPEQDAAALEAFLSQQMKFDPSRREDKTLYDIIYINGTHNLPNLGKYGEVRLLEEEFHRRMWSGEDA